MTTITTQMNIALEHLQRGDVVAIPTETVYGLAADATNEDAVKKIFAIKNRPLNHPLIMHVCHDWDLSQWVSEIPDYAQRMMDAFWPGPLTLVLNCHNKAINPFVNGGQSSIAIRAPKHDLTEALLRQLNRPLVAPSANPFGQVSPTTAKHVAHSFPHEDFLILDGGRCVVGIESTIVQATHHEGYAVLRPGMIHAQTIEKAFGKPRVAQSGSPRVSGQLDTHYMPQKKLYYVDDWQELEERFLSIRGDIYAISLSEHTPPRQVAYHHPLSSDASIVAYQLYDTLRQADHSPADVIVIELPPDEVRWQAIREKIMKAGQRLQASFNQ